MQYVQVGAPPEQTVRHQRLLLAILNAVSAYVGWSPSKYARMRTHTHTTHTAHTRTHTHRHNVTHMTHICTLLHRLDTLCLILYSLIFDSEFEGAFCRLLPDTELRTVPRVSRTTYRNGTHTRHTHRIRCTHVGTHLSYAPCRRPSSV